MSIIGQINDYQILQQVGSGSFSLVYRGRNIKTKQPVAIKVFKDLPRNDAISIQNQIELLKRIHHENIIRYIGDYKQKGKWYIVFQYCGKGDLQKFKTKQGTIPQAITKNFIYKILEAMITLHDNKIVHRDLKLANILINDEYNIKLADFGFSKDYESGLMTSYCGTPLTMAPQILKKNQAYDERCDTWSLGVICYQLIYGEYPFGPSKKYGPGMEGLINSIFQGRGPVFHEKIQVSNECKDFILKCLTVKIKQRPYMRQLKMHSWFQKGIKSQIRVNYLKDSLSDTTQLLNKTKQVIKGSIIEHILQVIKKAYLSKSQIGSNLKGLLELYPKQLKIHLIYLLIITKKMQEFMNISTSIKIGGFVFNLNFKSIKNINEHIKNLKDFIKEEISKRKEKIQLEEQINLQRQLIEFISKQGASYMKTVNNNIQKLSLLKKISEVALTNIQNTNLQVQWGIEAGLDTQQMQKKFDQFIQKMNLDQIIEIVNNEQIETQSYDILKSEWLIEHEIKEKKLQGIQFYIGNVLRNVLQIVQKVDSKKTQQEE